MRTNFLWFSAAAFAVILSVTPTLSGAVTNYVTSAVDSGPGSLRQAILDLNASGGGTIRFSNVSVITLEGELPEIQANMAIEAEGTNRVVLDGNQKGRVLSVGEGRTTILRGLRITGGSVTADLATGSEGRGGGILNQGDLTLINCSVDGNSADGTWFISAFGGGIYNAGSLLLISCSVSTNSVWGGYVDFASAGKGGGGGLYSKGSTVISNTSILYNLAVGGSGYHSETSYGQSSVGIGGGVLSDRGSFQAEASTFAFNDAWGGSGSDLGAAGYGGGVAGTNLRFVNCTFSQNTAIGGTGWIHGGPFNSSGFGGQINADGVVDLTSCTVMNGEATTGAAIAANAIRIKNTIIAGDGGGSTGDVTGLIISLGHNLIEGLASPPTSTDIVGLDPMLSPLQDNGGPTLTHLPLVESPAIDAGIGDGIPFDQRGFARTRDNLTFTNASGGDGTDIGSVELEEVGRLIRTTNYVTNLGDSGPGSLRQAILDVNGAYGGTILFSNLVGTIALSNDLPATAPDIVLQGPGRAQIKIDANYHRTFGAVTRISGLTIKNGRPAIGGAAMVSDCAFIDCRPALICQKSVSIVDTLFSDSFSSIGALRVYGAATLRNCEFSNNSLTAVCSYNGAAYRQGGAAILIESGQVSLLNCAFVNNNVVGYNYPCEGLGESANGGAIHIISGRLDVTDCTFAGNFALAGATHYDGARGGTARGGAIYLTNGVLNVTNCLFRDNQALGSDATTVIYDSYGYNRGGEAYGGAVFLASGTAAFANCTFSRNRAVGGAGAGYVIQNSYPGSAPGGNAYGGAISLSQLHSLSLLNCSIAENQALGGRYNPNWLPVSPPGRGLGGGVYNANGSNIWVNTIIAANIGSTNATPSNSVSIASDAWGGITSRGFNLITVTDSLSGFAASDRLKQAPLLGPLQDNGGPVWTHALLAGSPAIDAGSSSGLAFDARGQPRTVDDPAVPNASGGDGTDIGAFEVNPILTATETRRAGANVQVRFTTVSDKAYGIEYRPEVGEGPWIALPGTLTGTGGIVTYTDVNAAALPRRFYRIFERAR